MNGIFFFYCEIINEIHGHVKNKSTHTKVLVEKKKIFYNMRLCKNT